MISTTAEFTAQAIRPELRFRTKASASQFLKTLRLVISLALACLASARAEEARFFRVLGPVTTTITAFSADGYLTWTNEPTNATFTVQTASSLLSPTNWVDYVQVPATNPVTTERIYDPNPPADMVLIPAGIITMGDTYGDGVLPQFPSHPNEELPLHTNYVSAYYMDRYDVTKALWDEVYNWATNHGYSFDKSDSGQGKAANHPVQSMTWYDAVKWCNARSEKEGRGTAYFTTAAQTAVYRCGQTDVQNEWVKWRRGYRLPTEAEWEKAARGGASGQRFSWGNTISWSQANYYSYWSGGVPYSPYDVNPTPGYHSSFNDGVYPYTSPVGYFAPNGYGLYDMEGNVWQVCWDWYEAYLSSSQTDPRGPASGLYRVARGGGWDGGALHCRSAGRSYYYPAGSAYGDNDSGFRCVLPPGQ